MNASGSGGTAPVSPRIEMGAYDRLPASMRQVISAAALNWPAFVVEQWLAKGVPEREIVSKIETYERKLGS